MKSATSHHKAYLLLIVTMLMWSTNFVIARALHEQVGPFTLAFARWAIALCCLAPFALPRFKREWPKLRAQWKQLLLLGLFGIGLTNTFVYWAVQTTTATNAVILNSATPVMVLLLGSLYFRQRLSSRQWLGMSVALCGALLIVLKGNLAAIGAFHFGSGDLLVLAGGLCWAIYTLGLRKLKPGIDALVQMSVLLLVGELVLLPLFGMEAAQRGLPSLDGGAWASLIYLGALPSVVAYLMYNRAIAMVGTAKAASFLYLMPAFGAVQSIALLGEELHWFHAAGLAAIFAGIALSSLTRSAPAAATTKAVSGEPVRS
ncbi:DMT family transporter [Chromobacterium sp. IIBBL 290-4]|uniref:DMT family transporter n=1 Tax=Chromobacterium sp. IIBBL 290-4 TaxID=2953890 RepID=UPI0020B8A6FA|nr:DMT family transporter [Chromobacterium sp. IIBBL 290-4]UTH73233.1 DMT family transporter [Chromobacterium sp. IIBBL 290-4]